MITYGGGVDSVFKALADSTRRELLDELFEHDGQTLSALEARVEMTRFGVMKHLGVLGRVGLVITRRKGREKLHFLNPIPIRLAHDRWVSKYVRRAMERDPLASSREGPPTVEPTERLDR
jgi:DNA-binding transcriptional ArsR family regulator